MQSPLLPPQGHTGGGLVAVSYPKDILTDESASSLFIKKFCSVNSNLSRQLVKQTYEWKKNI